MPDKIDKRMIAVCGMNCKICYKHLAIGKYTKCCNGCKFQDETLPNSCRNCKLVACANEKNIDHGYKCTLSPCKLIKNLDKSYIKKYNISLIENSKIIKENGTEEFLKKEKEKWICKGCKGIISLHDKICSSCLAKK